MSLTAVQTNSARVGTCPHGLPLGACPICNGMGGGGMKKADFSAKPGITKRTRCSKFCTKCSSIPKCFNEFKPKISKYCTIFFK